MKAKVSSASVTVAIVDPNPLVAGGGLQYLRERGVDVRVGVRAAEARRLNEVFDTNMRRRRPFLTLKVAMSIGVFLMLLQVIAQLFRDIAQAMNRPIS